MGLYLGDKKCKINLSGAINYYKLIVKTSVGRGLSLLSSNSYLLKDCNGLYLIAKESE